MSKYVKNLITKDLSKRFEGLDAVGVINPRGEWAVQGPSDSTPAVVVTDVDRADISETGRSFRQRTRERVGS